MQVRVDRHAVRPSLQISGLTHASCGTLLGPRLDEEEEDDLQEEDADDGDDSDDDYDDYEARVFDACCCSGGKEALAT